MLTTERRSSIVKTIIRLGIVSIIKKECERRIKNQNFVSFKRQPKNSRTKFIRTYGLTLVTNVTIMIVWQSVPCKVNMKCTVKRVFEDYFRKRRVDLQIIFFTKRCFHLHSHISILKEEKEFSSETLVTIYQTIRRYIVEERSHVNLRTHKQRNFTSRCRLCIIMQLY